MTAAYRPTVLGLGLIAVLLAMLGALWNLGLTQADIGFPALVPDDPDIAMARATAELRAGQGRVSISALDGLRIAARLDPLEEEPFLFMALKHVSAGHAEQALPLLEEARRRNPRSRETRVALLESYFKAGDTAAAMREIAVLSRLLPQGRDALVAMQAGLVRTPRTRSTALAALRSSPLRVEVLEKLARDGAPSSLLQAIAADMKGIAARPEERGWVGVIAETLAARGDIGETRRLWAQFHAIEPARLETVPFDGSFRGLGGPPFGWKIRSGPAGLAEIAGGALQIQYFGRDGAEFARQLVQLAPGEYRLRFDALAAPRQPPADLAWRVGCLEGGALLLDLPLQAALRFAAPASGDFTVPDNSCQAQWLILIGRPDPFPQTRSLAVRQVVIERKDAP